MSIAKSEINTIIKYINKGLTHKQIAEELKYTKNEVHNFCQEYGIKSKYIRNRRHYPFTLEQVKKLYIDDNVSMKNVAEILGVSKGEMQTFIYNNHLVKYNKSLGKGKAPVNYSSEKEKPKPIRLKIRIGQDLMLTTSAKMIEDKLIKVKEKYRVIGIYPHCVLLAKIINKKPNMNIRICPSIWDLHRMMG